MTTEKDQKTAELIAEQCAPFTFLADLPVWKRWLTRAIASALDVVRNEERETQTTKAVLEVSTILDRHISSRRAYAEEFFFNNNKVGEKHFAFEVQMLEEIKTELIEKIKNAKTT